MSALPKLSEKWMFGEVFRCYSETFGTHDLLCIKCPGKSKEERVRFLEIHPDGRSGEVLFFSSAENDAVEKQWGSLLEYYHEVIE